MSSKERPQANYTTKVLRRLPNGEFDVITATGQFMRVDAESLRRRQIADRVLNGLHVAREYYGDLPLRLLNGRRA